MFSLFVLIIINSLNAVYDFAQSTRQFASIFFFVLDKVSYIR